VKETILIVDDHDSVRLILGNILVKQYNVVTKSDGIEAFGWLHKGNEPDLIVLDMVMPRLHGMTFLSNIKSSGLFSHIPVVVLTGNENKEFEMQVRTMGASGFIRKPFKPDNLRETIANTLQQTQTV
jgi:CheY-like chemotaxis protein